MLNNPKFLVTVGALVVLLIVLIWFIFYSPDGKAGAWIYDCEPIPSVEPTPIVEVTPEPTVVPETPTPTWHYTGEPWGPERRSDGLCSKPPCVQNVPQGPTLYPEAINK